ncbi:hypothetical protein C8J57DRAFT_1123330 [Mycena rebaudengoi]|nr:hypothetical protein C8J57DRAFT_1123330 [Mycena rebaudengoi]
MVVLAASICTKAGKAVVSRQFLDMSRTRIESLLASFPKLLPPPSSTQHTLIETPDVRYVYQPLEDLYILLITNKASNILQDIDTLHLLARVVSDMCRSAAESEVVTRAFELLGAFDEVVGQGYREGAVGLVQVRNALEMESHEEKIQEIIARNKEAEAKEELKRRAKQLEMQRREQQRRAAGSAPGFNSGSYGGGITGYSPVPQQYNPPTPTPSNNSSLSTPRAPAFKGTGMKLGSSKKTKQAELIDALGGDYISSLPEEPLTPSVPTAPILAAKATSANKGRGSLPEVEQESIHIHITEQIVCSLLRDGGLEKDIELKGDMNLHISDASQTRASLTLLPTQDSNLLAAGLQFKQHPNVAKFDLRANRTEPKEIKLRDATKSFPLNQSLAVLKWRYKGSDEGAVPLSINCWPTPSNDGTCEVSIEYELENDSVTLYDLEILIPLPAGSYPTVSSNTGEWSLEPNSHSLAWTTPLVSADSDTRSGSLMFTVGGDDPETFFPVRVSFIGTGSFAGVGVASMKLAEGDDAVFSVDSVVTADSYSVV